MATVTKRAACCNQATPARRTGQPAVGSRSSYSIARKKRRAKYLRRQITCLLLAAAALTALIYVGADPGQARDGHSGDAAAGH